MNRKISVAAFFISLMLFNSCSAQASYRHHDKHSPCFFLNGKDGGTVKNGDASGENGKPVIQGTACLNGGNGGSSGDGNASGGNGAPGANG